MFKEAEEEFDEDETEEYRNQVINRIAKKALRQSKYLAQQQEEEENPKTEEMEEGKEIKEEEEIEQEDDLQLPEDPENEEEDLRGAEEYPGLTWAKLRHRYRGREHEVPQLKEPALKFTESQFGALETQPNTRYSSGATGIELEDLPPFYETDYEDPFDDDDYNSDDIFSVDEEGFRIPEHDWEKEKYRKFVDDNLGRYPPGY